MMISKDGAARGKGQGISVGFVLVAAFMAACLLLVAEPAHAVTTGTRRSPSNTRGSRSRAMNWTASLSVSNRVYE
jgi:hypothetical protein